MNVAFLFDSENESVSGYYGGVIRNAILATNVLQTCSRTMRVFIGDILTHMYVSQSHDRTMGHLINVCKNVYSVKELNLLINDKLVPASTNSTVFCWMFQNMESEVAQQMHNELIKSKVSSSYLGAKDVVFSSPYDLKFFRQSLMEKYRFSNSKASIFYPMGEIDSVDEYEKGVIESFGFISNFEDCGARGSVLDDFDTNEHFKRIADIEKLLYSLPYLSPSDAEDVIHSLEELHPKLFNTISAAARTLLRYETEEDLAQVALSGRRLLEQIADYLFPAQKDKVDGRKVGKSEYKNRLWAYLAQITKSEYKDSVNIIATLGSELDGFVELFNKGLHGELDYKEVEITIAKLVIWLKKVIDLNPSSARKPYLAYEENLELMFKSVFN